VLTYLIKKTIYRCVTCTRMKAVVSEQKIGILPEARLKFARAFSYTGVDLTGPFYCECVGHRYQKMNKIYLVLFVCLTTRAVHLEIVSDLTVQRFLMCLQRFISRRGPVTEMYI